jgi:hypothetical protein
MAICQSPELESSGARKEKEKEKEREKKIVGIWGEGRALGSGAGDRLGNCCCYYYCY